MQHPAPIEVDVHEACRLYEAGALLLDVRELEEWQHAHAPGATHIPLGALGTRLHELPADVDIVCVCLSGARSDAAMRALRSHGLRALNMAGGMVAWSRAGLPLTRD